MKTFIEWLNENYAKQLGQSALSGFVSGVTGGPNPINGAYSTQTQTFQSTPMTGGQASTNLPKSVSNHQQKLNIFQSWYQKSGNSYADKNTLDAAANAYFSDPRIKADPKSWETHLLNFRPQIGR